MSRKSATFRDITGSTIVTGNMEGNISNQVTNSFNTSGQPETSIDMVELARELSSLRNAMKQEAKESEHDIATGEVAKAEQAAKKEDVSQVTEHLKSAGKWALDIATKIGAPLVVELIKQATGMK